MLYGENLFAFLARFDEIRCTYFKKDANRSYLYHSKPLAGFFSKRSFARMFSCSINAPVLDERTCIT
jgi:hypothetical protein